ncbi:MAG: FHA domain-containing protein, partial [Deltaproteobacteria bacterium]|nr:FHA domain-containing protein [Deltaproteobacteria bacterium]
PTPSITRPLALSSGAPGAPPSAVGINVHISSRQFALVERRRGEELLFVGSEQPAVVGRSERAGCRLPAMDDLHISREHCLVRLKELGGWEVLCLSELGLRVNGAPLRAGETLPLFDRDALELGRSRFEFRAGPLRVTGARREVP